jgi:hypothetical protein
MYGCYPEAVTQFNLKKKPPKIVICPGARSLISFEEKTTKK